MEESSITCAGNALDAPFFDDEVDFIGVAIKTTHSVLHSQHSNL
jgi:hypothetical protein